MEVNTPISAGSETSQGSSFDNSPASSGQSAPDPQITEYLESLRGNQARMESELAESRKLGKESSDALARIKQAIAGETPEAVDKDEEADKQLLDFVLEAALKDQKAGGAGLPLTTQLAVKLVEQGKLLRQATKALEDLKGKSQQFADPSFQQDQRAFTNIDAEIARAVEGLYGQYDPQIGQAVGSKVIQEIQRLRNEQPDIWRQISINPDYQRRLVLHHLEAVVPKKAKELLHRDQIQNTEMSTGDLIQALKEAHQQIKDPATLKKVTAKIRQQILAKKYGK